MNTKQKRLEVVYRIGSIITIIIFLFLYGLEWLMFRLSPKAYVHGFERVWIWAFITIIFIAPIVLASMGLFKSIMKLYEVMK